MESENAEKRKKALIRKMERLRQRMAKRYWCFTYEDMGWRIVVPQGCLDKAVDLGYKDAKELLHNSIYDIDQWGGYYWWPYDDPPYGYTTPAMRLAQLIAESGE